MPLQEVDPITGLPLHSDVPFTGQHEAAQDPDHKKLEKQLVEMTGMFNKSQKELKDLTTEYETLSQKYTDLLSQHTVLQSAIPPPAKPVVHPPVGTTVTFVNHGGVHEAAKVTGHGHRGVHLAIQGKHPNDNYSRQEIPAGDPTKPLTYFTNS